MKSGTRHDDPDEGHTNPNEDENEFSALAGESQEPADADSNFGDFWDSLTRIIATK